ncbi:hypothetical protein FDP41_004786 [Naegleria fowleri]|uniref:NADH dehydrogenase [ubiquinone] 1 beta subcomplex subunit 11, mitochondrial n=1 Tax=Naegleria fowleri TaxID=5763 RepID=A0A6A5BPD6_NAEFO|nr:uncharacterized protein FDP41_004786 [Naegleria fowleri]KAF0976111.1 hypothetical protein FDP41_004786 [Naegleria fowleri]CAG4718770.1 unnamed protein product [Naegleria fowleri]
MFIRTLSRISSASAWRNLQASSLKCYHTSVAQRGGGHHQPQHDEHHHEGEHDTHHDDHHEEPYTDNDGRLFGIPAGEQYKPKGWEYRVFPLMYGGIIMLVIGLAFKPDYSFQAWAKEEVLRRRAAREQQQ